jgi:7-cyano-7-deazaguanine synthase
MANTTKIPVLVLASGGLDSTVLMYSLAHDGYAVLGVSVQYGQRHGLRELVALKSHPQFPLREISVDLTYDTSSLTNRDIPTPDLDRDHVPGNPSPKSYVPFRNLTMLSIACGLAEDLGISLVAFGAHRSDQYGYWDTSQKFVQALQRVVELSRGIPIEILAPFAQLTKAEIVQKGLELGVPFERTWSCYDGQGPCGTCPTCRERQKAFESCEVKDPLLELRDK